MFKRILVAGRGEIALRVIRACREMDIETVAVYSQADRTSMPAQLATESVCIGPAAAKDSYLNMQNILTAALETGCEALHPCYGFLAENSEFAALCEKAGIKFIGPCAEVIAKMGNKAVARKLAMEAGVPVVPGSQGVVTDVAQAVQEAERLGYPVLIKAAAGGGGRGMRRVYAAAELERAFVSAKAEAEAAFGDGSMYMEKLIISPKHIEIQILADSHGNVVHLGERDCSIQRRNQKLLEECPSRVVGEELRQRMGRAAIDCARAAGYENAGTVEFVLDRDENFYFIEMNTRVQVEHPITELVTGIDIVKEQVRIAAGLLIRYKQDDIKLTGHAIECRINAENPANGFAPDTSEIKFLHLAAGAGVRVDTAIFTGYTPPPYYDSLLAKLVVHGRNRLEAIRRMRRVLEETIIEGPETNGSLLHLITYDQEFLSGEYTTAFLDENLERLLKLSAAASTG